MNRLQHIQKTLPANMAANKDYSNLEFVLLDYNSKDGLEEWIEKNFKEELAKGKLIFKRTDEPEHFDWSHSKNMAFGLASGDIVCNVDADNFTGPGFAKFINTRFQEKPNSFLSVDYKDNFNNVSDTFGRIACYKKDFIEIGGFDESMKGYSYEDIDFCHRLKLLGRTQHFITDKKYHDAIQHSDKDRISSVVHFSGISEVYINYLSPFISKILFLFKDGSYSFGTIQDLNEGFGNPTIREKQWVTGKYDFHKSEHLEICFAERSFKLWVSGINLVDEEGGTFYKIEDNRFLAGLERHYTVIRNHQILVNNMSEKRIKVN